MYSGCTVPQFVDGEKQHCLSNFQAIVINTVVCILCDAQFFSKQFDTFPKIGNGFYSLVQCVIGHVFLWWRGLMTGGVREKTRHLPPPFKET